MDATQKAIATEILRIAKEGKGMLFESQIRQNLKNKEDVNQCISIFRVLIDEYKLFNRPQIGADPKTLSVAGYKAARKGIDWAIRRKIRNDFVNGWIFRLISFFIPVIISIIALCKSCDSDMNRHDPIADLSEYLDPVHYIDDRGEVRTAYLQKDIPNLPINDKSKVDNFVKTETSKN